VSRIRWSHSARRDHRDVVEWLNDRNPAAASRIADAIENRLAMLAMMLRIGRVGRLEDTRELVIPRTPYLIIYQLEAPAIKSLCFVCFMGREDGRRSHRRLTVPLFTALV
jgi:toxin ParE1/3/4